LGIVLESRRPSDQFLVHGIANLDWSDFNWRRRFLSSGSRAGNQEETVVVEDISSIARSAFRTIAEPHADRGSFVGGITAPVGFPANSARSVFSNSTKAVDSNSLSLRKVDDPAEVEIRNIN